MPHVELPQAEFKAVMLGDTDSGKTSLVLRFAEGYFRHEGRISTIGAFFITKRIQTSSGVTCKIQIWDTAGQPQFRLMAPMYYKNAAAAIVCYDITSARSYQIMTEWLDELHRNIPAGSMVIAIAATKCDMIEESRDNREEEKNTDLHNDNTASGQLHNGADAPQVAVPLHEAERLAESLGAIFVRTSAKDNVGVDNLYKRVTERVLRYRKQSESGIQGPIPVTPGAVAKDLKRCRGKPNREKSWAEAFDTPGVSTSTFLGSTRALYDDPVPANTTTPLPVQSLEAPTKPTSEDILLEVKRPSSSTKGDWENASPSSNVSSGAFSFNGFSDDKTNGGETTPGASTHAADKSTVGFDEFSKEASDTIVDTDDPSYAQSLNTGQNATPAFCVGSPFMCDMFSASTSAGGQTEPPNHADATRQTMDTDEEKDKNMCCVS